MNLPVIVDAIRSPMARAKPDGALAQLHPVDLLSQVLEQLLQRNPALIGGRLPDAAFYLDGGAQP